MEECVKREVTALLTQLVLRFSRYEALICQSQSKYTTVPCPQTWKVSAFVFLTGEPVPGSNLFRVNHIII